jgi:hypothetical protein
MISSTVAHAAVLFKNHLPGLNLELLRQDFTVNDAERETLVSSAFDVALKTLYLHMILLVLSSSMITCRVR